MNNWKPFIGITTRHDRSNERFCLSRFYAEAIAATGGIPFMLPLILNNNFSYEAIERLDGILLPGSPYDVDPLRYGDQPKPELGEVDPLRDEIDALLLIEAEKRGMPVLAICYGMQALNVSRGGTLIQDIASEVREALKHEQGSPRDRHSHYLKFADGSILSDVNDGLKASVNSHHHQGVLKIGETLVPTAWAPDGLVEAIEDPRPDRFVVGVQWHPEIAWEKDPLSQKLFSRFTSEAQKFHDKAELLVTAPQLATT